MQTGEMAMRDDDPLVKALEVRMAETRERERQAEIARRQDEAVDMRGFIAAALPEISPQSARTAIAHGLVRIGERTLGFNEKKIRRRELAGKLIEVGGHRVRVADDGMSMRRVRAAQGSLS